MVVLLFPGDVGAAPPSIVKEFQLGFSVVVGVFSATEAVYAATCSLWRRFPRHAEVDDLERCAPWSRGRLVGRVLVVEVER